VHSSWHLLAVVLIAAGCCGSSQSIISSEMATIAYGDRVLLYEGFENQKVVTMTRGQVFQCRFGAFPHEYFVGKQFGSKVLSFPWPEC